MIVAVASLLSVASIVAQESPLGSPAPAFAIEKCLHGKPVTQLAKGVVHLVHFWGEEPAALFDVERKFAALQRKHGSKLRVVCVLKDSEDYDLAAVQNFYRQNEAKPSFVVGWDSGGALHKSWVEAAGHEGRVACLVDAEGKLAWMDGVGFLDLAIDKVVAGKADVKTLLADTEAAKKMFTKVMLIAGLKPAGARAELDKFLQAHPALASVAVPAVYNSLADEAEGLAHAIALQPLLCDVLIKAEDADSLNGLAWSIVDPESELAKRDLVTAAKAAKQAVELTMAKDSAVLDTYARVFFWQKDYPQAVAWQQKAVDLASGEARAELAETLKSYQQLAAGK